MWALFVRMSSQWRQSFGGRTGLDYGPAVALVQERGWRLERTLDFLRVIEHEWLEWDDREREREPGQR